MNKDFEILKVLSDETRFKIINLLLRYDLCVGGIAKEVGISKSAVSQHLQILRKAELVTGEKRGYYTHYTVNRNLLAKLGEKLIELSSVKRYAECSSFKEEQCNDKTDGKSKKNKSI